MASKKSRYLLRPKTRPDQCGSCGRRLPNWPRCHVPSIGGRVCLDCYRRADILDGPRQGQLFGGPS